MPVSSITICNKTLIYLNPLLLFFIRIFLLERTIPKVVFIFVVMLFDCVVMSINYLVMCVILECFNKMNEHNE